MLCTAGRDDRRDEHQSNVFDVLELLDLRLALRIGGQAVPHQLHVAGQGPQRRLAVAVARAAQAHDQPHAVQRVLFLPLDAADVADVLVGTGGGCE